MEVFVLVGSSGTGKSFRAISVAKQKNIEYIIDDGLLIKGNKVLGGSSAKREKSKMSAIKRALFIEDDHRRKIIRILDKEKPNRILILGTSDKMVESIVETLGVGEIKEWIFIEDVASKDEIRLARKYRVKEGKHIIPVPTFEIKKDFSGYFLNPLKIFRNFSKEEAHDWEERSVVRPTFSYMGRYFISNGVIEDLVYHVASKIIGIFKINNININNTNNGLIIEMDARIVYGNPIRPLVERLQEQVKTEIEDMTSFNIVSIDVNVKNLVIL
ncbi:Asp23/Gls24 family envelope stress response protein [Alkaliphilus sp. B6464]|uniref:Asp23/Gls24 family envelope stress response protein n=1 Tax=Alkaliphilus sp. B6464 TaxID=2731219 RepID=UPI001BA989A8|nr:Asp23/Gls24 family envelope stress response protein [Alkaliphilus sp. B6464]QUH18971.1 Asp23/Gls24 family envelope stress response protein [Alkaliphilus sp. B6464]